MKTATLRHDNPEESTSMKAKSKSKKISQKTALALFTAELTRRIIINHSTAGEKVQVTPINEDAFLFRVNWWTTCPKLGARVGRSAVVQLVETDVDTEENVVSFTLRDVIGHKLVK